ncbi:MAG: hypothetical protein A2X64_04420 [Ignavibacteria bacterium GWF2_33_9]|nr:MAG: hypothetical protein A2X64_04420 [Ignavibacteria bacterium GWF2_33_9]
MKKFKNITISIPEEKYEFAFAVLMDFTILGIREDYDKLIVTFDDEIWNENVKTELLMALQSIHMDVFIEKEELIFSKNWNEEFEKNVPLIKVSDRISIAPEWKKHESESELTIVINPKMSFGTGQHETTRLISRLMEKYVQEGQFWIDAGTGTGVLAILAIKLGAKSCFAFDNHTWSTENAIENVALNKVQDYVEVQQIDIDEFELPKADGIAANLYANMIIGNAGKFAQALSLGAPLIVSGILVYDKDDLIKSVEKNGFKLIEYIQEAEWVSIAFERV